MNLSPYTYLRDGNDMEPMDERHVQMINAVLVGERPESIVNIGVANGFSSVATIHAVSHGCSDYGYFVDLHYRECFRKILGVQPRELQFKFYEMNSRDWQNIAECWIIDGCHKEGAVTDYENARKSNARIVIAHDTSPLWQPEGQWGAIEIGKRMRQDAVAYFEDHMDRPGELTKRGLTIAFYYQPKEETMRKLQELNQ